MATVEQDTNHKTFLIQYNEKDRSMWMWQWDDINGNGFLDPERYLLFFSKQKYQTDIM